MAVGPLARSMRHHKGVFSLLVLEVAFGFVILVHTLISVRYYLRIFHAETGMADSDLVLVRRRFVTPRNVETARLIERADLAALARAAGVLAASAFSAPPLAESLAFPSVLRGIGPDARVTLGWPIRATQDGPAVLGLRLVAGRGLAESRAVGPDGIRPAIITGALARALFGDNPAVGRLVDGGSWGQARIAGVVDDFQFRGAWVPAGDQSIIIAAEPVSEQGLLYVVRAARGLRGEVAAKIPRLLTADATLSAEPFDRAHTRQMNVALGGAIVLSWTGLLVLAVVLSGSMALGSFSVAERSRQIGLRRALGATRWDIVRYVLTENVLFTTIGLALGLALSWALNLILRRVMVELVLTPAPVVFSLALLLVTGLLSALLPARRAAAIPPTTATRTL